MRVSHSISLSLSEGVRAARQRARQEICWTNNLRSSTTSLTPSLIQQASCAWCPETTCSTGMRFWQITCTSLHSHSPNQQALLRPTFPHKKKKIKNICLGKEIRGYCVSSVKESFLHCLASAEAACESSLLNRLSRAKLLKPLWTAYSDGALCVCVCVCVPDTDTDMVLRCLPCLCLFVVQIYDCWYFSESASS